ncbi:Vacuolar sorting protein 18 [Camellia lanceoleosa]|uniref:Vacuolar sorting protein 18 n=1 Tax=Camellia lanceoleosa TaxID=1840588 RepID=A0ACC0GTB4_9ERIC|nr:Vacuolar sorting protein 18 [Camellia lanceoleosa]
MVLITLEMISVHLLNDMLSLIVTRTVGFVRGRFLLRVGTIGWLGLYIDGCNGPFYVFPCGHAFHAQCLIAHVTRCTHRDQAEYILDLQKQLTLLGGESKESNGTLAEGIHN